MSNDGVNDQVDNDDDDDNDGDNNQVHREEGSSNSLLPGDMINDYYDDDYDKWSCDM